MNNTMKMVEVSFDTFYNIKTTYINNCKIRNRGEFIIFEGDNKRLTIRRSQIIYMNEVTNEE